MTTLLIINVKKSFASKHVLRGVSFEARSGDVVGILGSNGSGKSTLMRVIAGILRPDSGSVVLSIDDKMTPTTDAPFQCGYVAPYLEVYDEFTPRELLLLHAKLHATTIGSATIDEILARVGLDNRSNNAVRTFSSGMRQRVSIALATCLQPPLLLLDEPSITLDTAGRILLANEILAHRNRGGIVLLATNNERERDLCTQTITV